MTGDERGPSWYDVSITWATLGDDYGVFVELHLAPPIRRADGRGYSPWGASVRLRERGGAQTVLRGFTRHWGSAGGSRTCPQALYLALLDAEAWLEERKAAAEAQARF